MEKEAIYPVGGNLPLATDKPHDFLTYLRQNCPETYTMEDLLRDDTGGSGLSTTTVMKIHPELESPEAIPGVTQQASYSTGDPGPFTTLRSSSPTDFGTQQVNAALAPTATVVQDIVRVDMETARRQREPIPLVVHVGLRAQAQPDPYFARETVVPSTAADKEIFLSSLKAAAAGLPQPGTGGRSVTEAPVRGACKGKGLSRSSIRRRSSSPPDAAVRNYYAKMVTEQRTRHGYWWKGKRREVVRDHEPGPLAGLLPAPIVALNSKFKLCMNDGTKTKLSMDEYVQMDAWGIDLFIKGPCFRKVFNHVQEVLAAVAVDQPTPTQANTSKKLRQAKHRMRGPDDPKVQEGESPAWEHFIKIYDKYPELDGSKIVYAVCCYCDHVLKAGTDNGTSSLLTHCNRTCRHKSKPPACHAGSSSHAQARDIGVKLSFLSELGED